MYFAGKRIFFDKKYCTKSFRQPFSNGCVVEVQSPVVLLKNEILFKISAGGVGKCPVGRFSRRTLAGDPVAVYMNSAFMHSAI